jgi:hypothetical protein
MLKHLFTLFRVQKCSNIGTVSTWMGDCLEWYPHSRKKADCSCWPPVLYHIVRKWYTRVHTPKGGFWKSGTLANPSRPERVKNKQTKQTNRYPCIYGGLNNIIFEKKNWQGASATCLEWVQKAPRLTFDIPQTALVATMDTFLLTFESLFINVFLPAALSEAEGLRHWNDNFPPHPPDNL